ncbi:hypothetical protein [Bacillus cereus]|uniref:hypothetical protein n=1 Tax=Bacillus cereus TaxID=1396 RepID=UPI0001A0EC58|nr:hypothetical protein [Bacillus cereus]EEL54890.1 hypothetical protein bcere0023_35650 [Bacillus cereus Rock4-2]PGQ20978.1 hypothetical protein COA13_06325 [Bacillus cereus]
MRFDGALVKERGVTFAIVVVKRSVLNSSNREEVRRDFARFFPLGTPVILMAQDSSGIPTYHGRTDIVNFLANIDPTRIPWQRYSA